jgi:hypothetical protein
MSEVKQSLKVVSESHPEIAQKIKLFWGAQEFTNLVCDLIYDTRGATRNGFAVEVIASLMTLKYWHDWHFPQFVSPTANNWKLNSRQATPIKQNSDGKNAP